MNNLLFKPEDRIVVHASAQDGGRPSPYTKTLQNP
jgi:hypothetical protein